MLAQYRYRIWILTKRKIQNHPPHSTRIGVPLNAVPSLAYNLSYSLEKYNKTSVNFRKTISIYKKGVSIKTYSLIIKLYEHIHEDI